MQNSRYLAPAISDWLLRRMVFIGGPRQVGKTHLAKSFLTNGRGYLNWDDFDDRDILKKNALPRDLPLLVVDEIHKYPRWRTLLKGFFDKYHLEQKMIVTGSARLDLFRKGGDSLFGRYHYFRLHPFTFNELQELEAGQTPELKSLLTLGGFPEPYLTQSETFAKIWRRERKARVLREDLRDLTTLKDYTYLELLADALPSRVGSLLSLNSLAEDLEKSPHTIARWIEILEQLYYCYTIRPFGTSRLKGVKKARKLYLWDWSELNAPGAQFENMVASHLLKTCHYREDTEGDPWELCYLRNNQAQEIDFVLLKNKTPVALVECKVTPQRISPELKTLRSYLPKCPLYLVHMGREYWTDGLNSVVPFDQLVSKLGLQ